MIYKDHNFTENFCNAIGYNDEGMMKDIILDELSRLIVDEKTDVVKLLRDNDINVSVKDNDIVIANIITNEISKGNDKITKGIADLIAKSQFNSESYKSFSGKLSADGKATKFLENVNKVLSNPVVQDSVSTVAALGLKKAFDKKNPTTTAKNTANMTERLKMNQASKTKKKVNVKVILIIIGVTTLIGILAIKLYKSRQT
jgi:hypothetical protein